MKKIQLLVILIMLMFIFTSCSILSNSMSLFNQSDESIADKTFEKLINAIETSNKETVKAMFSNAIQENENLEEKSLQLLEFIKGDIVSYSLSADSGVGADYRIKKGKRKKEIQSSFRIVTTESEYYMAIKECVKDDFDSSNVGVLSIYIIKAEDWKEDCVYRGGGEWTPGITIDGR